MSNKGQALFEFVIVLPIFIFLMILGFQVFKAIDNATVVQKSVQNATFNQIDNRANGGQGLRGVELVSGTSPAISTGGLPMLSTDTQSQPPTPIQIKMGMCRKVEACEK